MRASWAGQWSGLSGAKAWQLIQICVRCFARPASVDLTDSFPAPNKAFRSCSGWVSGLQIAAGILRMVFTTISCPYSRSVNCLHEIDLVFTISSRQVQVRQLGMKFVMM